MNIDESGRNLTATKHNRYRTACLVLHAWCIGHTVPLIARFMGPTWGPSGADRTQVGPMLAPWTLLCGISPTHFVQFNISLYLVHWYIYDLHMISYVYVQRNVARADAKDPRGWYTRTIDEIECDNWKFINIEQIIIIESAVNMRGCDYGVKIALSDAILTHFFSASITRGNG